MRRLGDPECRCDKSGSGFAYLLPSLCRLMLVCKCVRVEGDGEGTVRNWGLLFVFLTLYFDQPLFSCPGMLHPDTVRPLVPALVRAMLGGMQTLWEGIMR